MANINDYLLWRGDLTLKASPFNEIDSMIMARLSYMPFESIKLHSVENVESLSFKLEGLPITKFIWPGDQELSSLIGSSIRFKDMEVTDIVKENIKNKEQQFAAITIHLNDKEIYISYIGTDATVIGWKEDFNMSFSDSVPCQIAGKKYLYDIAKKYPNKTIRLGGHSKGGNVSIYAGMTASKEIQKRIIKIYNYDGPGFPRSQLDKYIPSKIERKIMNYYPEDSIIGQILNHIGIVAIVKSTAKGIMGHDIYTWEVIGTRPVYAEKRTDTSEVMRKSVTNWLDNTTAEQRKIFIDSIFELLYSTKHEKFKEILANIPKCLTIILKKYGEIPSEDKETISTMLKIFAKCYLKERIGVEKEKLYDTMKKWREDVKLNERS